MQTSTEFKRPNVSAGPPRQAAQPLGPSSSGVDEDVGDGLLVRAFFHAAEVELHHVGVDSVLPGTT